MTGATECSMDWRSANVHRGPPRCRRRRHFVDAAPALRESCKRSSIDMAAFGLHIG